MAGKIYEFFKCACFSSSILFGNYLYLHETVGGMVSQLVLNMIKYILNIIEEVVPMATYNLMTIISFAINIAPFFVLMSKRLRTWLANIILLLIRPELTEFIKPIVQEEIKTFEKEQAKQEKDKKKTASSLLTRLRRLFR